MLQLAVRTLDLAIGKGECFGLLGPNGAGKSSSISMLVGLVEPTDGTAIIGGHDIITDMDAIYRYCVQLLFLHDDFVLIIGYVCSCMVVVISFMVCQHACQMLADLGWHRYH